MPPGWGIENQLKKKSQVPGGVSRRGGVKSNKRTMHYYTKRKQTTAIININVFEDAQKQLEKFCLNFPSSNPFPPWPSAAKDTC